MAERNGYDCSTAPSSCAAPGGQRGQDRRSDVEPGKGGGERFALTLVFLFPATRISFNRQ